MGTSISSAAETSKLSDKVTAAGLGSPFSKRLIGSACALIALAWALLMVDLWHMRDQRIQQANEQASALAKAVEQRVMRTLRVTDQMLRLVREEVIARQAWNDHRSLTGLLEALSPNLDEILTVSFIAANGTSLAHSNPAIPVGRHYTGSDFFMFHTAGTGDDLYVEKPIIGPASGLRIFTLSRPLRDKSGRFLGIIVASVRADAIASEFSEFRIGKNGSIGFHHLPSYLIIARQPDFEATFAQGLEHQGLRTAISRSPQGTFEGEISSDGVKRLFAYRKIDALPLTITVGVAHADIDAALSKELAGYLAVILALTVAIGGGTALLLRAHRRELALREHIAEKEALFRAFFEAIPAGMCTLDREMRYCLVNPSMARINNKPLEDYLGRTVEEVHPALLDKLAPIHRDIVATGAEWRDIEFHGKRFDQPGTTGCWLASFFPIPDSRGEVDAIGCFVIDVTAQKQAEAELRRSETMLSTVLSIMPVGVWITDPEGRIVRNNAAGEMIWQGKRLVAPADYGEYKGWWADSGKPIASEEWALARAIRNGESSIKELIEIECFDGTRKTILNSALPMHAANGQLLGAIAINEDISDVQRAKEEMRISRDFFEQTFNIAPLGMAIADKAGRYIKVNRAMAKFVGYSEEELLSMTFMDVTHPDDLQLNVDLRAGILTGETSSIEIEKRYLRKDGSSVWAIMVATAICDKNGEPLYSIGQMLDIDRQKKYEQFLRESEARFRAIFDNAITGIAATDGDGVVCYFNEAFRAMLGYDAETLQNTNFAHFTHPDDLAREYRFLEEICTGDRDSYRMEKRYLRADKRVVWVDLSTSTIKDESGRIINLIAVVHDITEKVSAAQALSQSRQKLRALSAHQTRILEEDRKHIAREIHDELGQLLTALKMDVSLLRMKFGDIPALQEKTDEMRGLVDKTMAVVRDVSTNLRPAALDLGLLPAIEWLAEDFSARWGIPCVVEASGEIKLTELLSTTIFRVVQESLTNIARHASAHKVDITLRQDPRVLHLFINDDGCGFDMASTAKRKGFGFFGMRERVLSVGGKLRIDSTPGNGTTVTITLPLPSDTCQ